MARIARFVVPRLPHHVNLARRPARARVLRRGRLRTLSRSLASQCRKHGVAVFAYWLMPNHVRRILVPDRKEALERARASRSGKAAPWGFASVPGLTGNTRFGSEAEVQTDHY